MISPDSRAHTVTKKPVGDGAARAAGGRPHPAPIQGHGAFRGTAPSTAVDLDSQRWQYLTVVNYLGSVTTRPLEQDDLRWVLSRSVHEMRGLGEIDPSTWEKAIRRAAIDPGAVAIVAHPDGFDADLVAWAIGFSGGLVGVYVHPPWRGLGIGRGLIAQAIPSPEGHIPCAFWTLIASQMAKKGFPIRYDLEYRQQIRRMAK